MAFVVGITPKIAHPQQDKQGTFTWMMDGIKQEFGTIWREGSNELYLPLYTWHLPFAYSAEKRDGYVEYPAGVGISKGLSDEQGNWHSLYAMIFRDSHGNPEPIAGYAWAARWGNPKGFKAGVGYTVFLTARSDYDWVPFPAVLPIATLEYNRYALQTTYIPGGSGFGNVILLFGKYTFDK